MDEQKAPVVTIYPNGKIEVGQGYTLGQVLQALDFARQAMLSIVLNPGQPDTQ